MSDVEQQIAGDRDRLGVSEVRLHHVPNWFRLAVLRAFKAPYRYHTAGWAAIYRLQAVDERCCRWIDHWGSTKVAGQQIFVSEPYNLTDDHRNSIQQICDAINCDWYESSLSWWYPGHTVRVGIHQRP